MRRPRDPNRKSAAADGCAALELAGEAMFLNPRPYGSKEACKAYLWIYSLSIPPTFGSIRESGGAHIPIKHVAAITHKLQARGLQTWSGGEIGRKYDPGLVALSVALYHGPEGQEPLSLEASEPASLEK